MYICRCNFPQFLDLIDISQGRREIDMVILLVTDYITLILSWKRNLKTDTIRKLKIRFTL